MSHPPAPTRQPPAPQAAPAPPAVDLRAAMLASPSFSVQRLKMLSSLVTTLRDRGELNAAQRLAGASAQDLPKLLLRSTASPEVDRIVTTHVAAFVRDVMTLGKRTRPAGPAPTATAPLAPPGRAPGAPVIPRLPNAHPPPPPGPPPAKATSATGDRWAGLANLKRLLEAGMLTQAEYDARRTQIIDSLTGSSVPGPRPRREGPLAPRGSVTTGPKYIPPAPSSQPPPNALRAPTRLGSGDMKSTSRISGGGMAGAVGADAVGAGAVGKRAELRSIMDTPLAGAADSATPQRDGMPTASNALSMTTTAAVVSTATTVDSLSSNQKIRSRSRSQSPTQSSTQSPTQSPARRVGRCRDGALAGQALPVPNATENPVAASDMEAVDQNPTTTTTGQKPAHLDTTEPKSTDKSTSATRASAPTNDDSEPKASQSIPPSVLTTALTTALTTDRKAEAGRTDSYDDKDDVGSAAGSIASSRRVASSAVSSGWVSEDEEHNSIKSGGSAGGSAAGGATSGGSLTLTRSPSKTKKKRRKKGKKKTRSMRRGKSGDAPLMGQLKRSEKSKAQREEMKNEIEMLREALEKQQAMMKALQKKQTKRKGRSRAGSITDTTPDQTTPVQTTSGQGSTAAPSGVPAAASQPKQMQPKQMQPKQMQQPSSTATQSVAKVPEVKVPEVKVPEAKASYDQAPDAALAASNAATDISMAPSLEQRTPPRTPPRTPSRTPSRTPLRTPSRHKSAETLQVSTRTKITPETTTTSKVEGPAEVASRRDSTQAPSLADIYAQHSFANLGVASLGGANSDAVTSTTRSVDKPVGAGAAEAESNPNDTKASPSKGQQRNGQQIDPAVSDSKSKVLGSKVKVESERPMGRPIGDAALKSSVEVKDKSDNAGTGEAAEVEAADAGESDERPPCIRRGYLLMQHGEHYRACYVEILPIFRSLSSKEPRSGDAIPATGTTTGTTTGTITGTTTGTITGIGLQISSARQDENYVRYGLLGCRCEVTIGSTSDFVIHTQNDEPMRVRAASGRARMAWVRTISACSAPVEVIQGVYMHLSGDPVSALEAEMEDLHYAVANEGRILGDASPRVESLNLEIRNLSKLLARRIDEREQDTKKKHRLSVSKWADFRQKTKGSRSDTSGWVSVMTRASPGAAGMGAAGMGAAGMGGASREIPRGIRPLEQKKQLWLKGIAVSDTTSVRSGIKRTTFFHMQAVARLDGNRKEAQLVRFTNRFSEFLKMHALVARWFKKRSPRTKLPIPPSKHSMSVGKGKAFNKARKADLERYIEQMSRVPGMKDCTPFLDFINAGDQDMTVVIDWDK